jgi:hypothetical protein
MGINRVIFSCKQKARHLSFRASKNMSTAIKFEELDATTREYLHQAKSRAGTGMPGIYVSKGYSRLFWALFVGPVIALGFFVMSLGSTKDAGAIAMLQTAGLLLGSWLTFFAYRRWTTGRSNIYGGYFLYFDPLHVYDVAGETITIINLNTVRSVTTHSTRGGSIEFDLGFGRSATIAMPSSFEAAKVESYYAAMAELEEREAASDPWESDVQHQQKGPRKPGFWSAASVAEIGLASKYIVENGLIPKSSAEIDLDVVSHVHVPESPSQVRRAGWGIGPIFLWIIATGLVYCLLWKANVPIQDSFAFLKAKSAGAPGLRAYLLDDRNTMYRDEAKQMLAKLYDAPIAAIRNSATPAITPIPRQALIRLLESLKTVEVQPVLTLRIESIGAADSTRSDKIQTDLSDSLGQTIGRELIAFAEPPEENKPHILIRYLDDKAVQSVGVDIYFQFDPDAEKPELEAHFTMPIDDEEQQEGSPDQIAVMLATVLAGEFRARPIFISDFE